MFLLISRQTAPFHCGPILCISNNSAVASSYMGEVIPVTTIAIQRDISVGEVKIECSVIVQIAKLGTKAPAAKFDSQVAGDVLEGCRVATRSLARHPKIVALNQNPVFGNIR